MTSGRTAGITIGAPHGRAPPPAPLPRLRRPRRRRPWLAGTGPIRPGEAGGSPRRPAWPVPSPSPAGSSSPTAACPRPAAARRPRASPPRRPRRRGSSSTSPPLVHQLLPQLGRPPAARPSGQSTTSSQMAADLRPGTREVHHAHFRSMGAEAHVIVVDGRPSLLSVARRRLGQLEACWSRFIPTSEISTCNRLAGMPVWVSADTALLIDTAAEGWHLDAGRFDPTVPSATSSGPATTSPSTSSTAVPSGCGPRRRCSRRGWGESRSNAVRTGPPW